MANKNIDQTLIQKIKDKAVELGVDPSLLLSIAYKESRIRTGLTGDKHLKNKAHGIFQVRLPALKDVNDYYKTSYTIDNMKDSLNDNITAGALYFKMMADKYGAKTTKQQLAMYNGGPGAKKGKNTGANAYATSVQSYTKTINDIIGEPQPKTVTPSKNIPFRSPRPKRRPTNLVPDVDFDDAYGDDFRTDQQIAIDKALKSVDNTNNWKNVIQPPLRKDVIPQPIPKPDSIKAKSNKLTYLDLAKMNKITDPNSIQVGQKIKLPDGSKYVVQKGETLSGIAKLHNRVTESDNLDVELWNDIFKLSEATSSPGRVKRAGASCSGSVTELRALAKKNSGTEKGKMYHWCANMKGSKKESLQEVLTDITSSTQVFVDMDGVLADFFGEWNKLIGRAGVMLQTLNLNYRRLEIQKTFG